MSNQWSLANKQVSTRQLRERTRTKIRRILFSSEFLSLECVVILVRNRSAYAANDDPKRKKNSKLMILILFSALPHPPTPHWFQSLWRNLKYCNIECIQYEPVVCKCSQCLIHHLHFLQLVFTRFHTHTHTHFLFSVLAFAFAWKHTMLFIPQNVMYIRIHIQYNICRLFDNFRLWDS